MRCLFAGTAFLAYFLLVINSSSFAQLRNISEYLHDRLDPDHTYFILRDSGEAEFGWTSEWTAETSIACEGKSAMLLWHFKDGSKAYSKVAEDVGNIGKNMSYLIAGKSSSLEDMHRKKIQPLTRSNYPVKVELWIGKVEASSGYAPEALGDSVCFSAPGIEQDHSYHFSGCPHAEH